MPTTSSTAPGLTGVVRDSAGRPVSNVLVIIAQLNRTSTTNDEGTFRFTSLPSGSYHLATQRYADATSRIKTFALNPGRNIARLQGPVLTARQCA